MDRPTRIIIVPAVLMLCGLTGCVVETPVRHDVVVERPAPVYAAPPAAVIVRPSLVRPDVWLGASQRASQGMKMAAAR